MPSLPTPGGDSGVWGDELNAFLGVSLAADGTMNAGVVGATVLASGAATSGEVATATGWGSVTYASVSGDHLGLTPTAVKTAAYTAVAGDLVPVDTTSGGVTVGLPVAPTNGSVVAIKHVIQGSTNVVTFNCGGSDVFNKASGATTGTLKLSSQGVLLQYKSSGAIWYVVADDLPLASTDLRYYQVGNGAVTPVAIADGGTGAVTAAAARTALGVPAALITENVQTVAYTALLTDAGNCIVMNLAGANALTIPPNSSQAFPVGTVLMVHQYGAGQTTLTAGAGVTIRSDSGALKLAAQYASASLRKRATDEWVAAGDLST